MARRSRNRVFRQALSHRDYRYLLGAHAISYTGDWLFSVALLGFVLEETGSSGWLAAATFTRMLPFVIFSPLGGLIADRYNRRTVLVVSDIARGCLMGALVVVSLSSLPIAVVVGLAFLSATAGTPHSPAVAAMLPGVVGERDLAAANAVTSTVDNVALMLGPALGGLLLATASPPVAFAVNGASFALSALILARLRGPESPVSTETPRPVRDRLREGFGAIAAGEIGVFVALLVAATFVYGHELVLLPLVSDRFLDTGAGGVGWLLAAVGAGGLLAVALGGRLAAHPRPTIVLSVSGLAMGLPLACLAIVETPGIAYALMAVEGAGTVVFDVTGITLAQRALRLDLAARVFGIIDALGFLGILVGLLVAPLLVETVGLRAALVTAGVVLPVLSAIAFVKIRSLEMKSRLRLAEIEPVLDFLSHIELWAGTPRQSLELLAQKTEAQQVPRGAFVVRESEPAHDVFIVRRGKFEVLSSGETGGTPVVVNELVEGDYFGEIGILENIPRTASVRATTDALVYRIAGQDFLEAIGPLPSLGTVLDILADRLARTHPTYHPARVEGFTDMPGQR